MVYMTQNYRVSGLRPKSGIRNTRKHNVSETDLVTETLRLLVLRIPDNEQSKKPSNSVTLTFYTFRK